MLGAVDDTTSDARQDPDDRALSLVVVVLVAYRLAYHASYLGEVPFAHGTFADGAVYEQAARDILADPPLGTQAFYLQGAYAYFLALAMAIRPWPSLGLLLQLAAAFASLWLLHRSALKLWGRRAALLSTIALLAHPGLAFYENKHLSAELGVIANMLVFASFVAILGRRREPGRPWLLGLLGLGAASGFAVLARPNMVLALPFSLVGVVSLVRGRARSGVASPSQTTRRDATLAVALVSLGFVLALAPMAARNLAVTGHADVQPVHGGGTSFYIGNNPKSKGVWNDAGLMSARLGTESQELAEQLGVEPGLSERERAKAIGDVLYAKAFDWIADNPWTWVKLEVHKLWLTVGDQQLTQDYDWLGEQELLPWAHRVGLRFSGLLGIALLGAGAVLMGRWRPEDLGDASDDAGFIDAADGSRPALAWFLAGQVLAPLAANVLYFTSAQHRLPLVVPMAFLAGPGVLALVATARARLRRGDAQTPATSASTLPLWLIALALVAVIQGKQRRSPRTQPHPVHYYNLAMVQDQIGEPVLALEALDRAIELRPNQPIFHMRRAHLRLRFSDLDGAEQDLDVVTGLAEAGGVPDWVLQQVALDRQGVAFGRSVQALEGSR